MAEPITKTMPEILIDRMNATRKERIAATDKALQCAYIEEGIMKLLSGYGVSVTEGKEGYAEC